MYTILAFQLQELLESCETITFERRHRSMLEDMALIGSLSIP